MKDKEQYLTELLSRVISKTAARENIPRRMEDGTLLYRSELHVIDAIGSHPKLNMTAIAEIIGVTKGAVSQKVKLLEEKGYINRYKNPDNHKEVFFELTKKGTKTYQAHKDFHRQLNKKLFDAMGGYSPEDLDKIISFLAAIEKHLETI